MNEEIKIQFYIHNPLFKEIELTDCKIILAGKGSESNQYFTITPESITIKVKGNAETMV